MRCLLRPVPLVVLMAFGWHKQLSSAFGSEATEVITNFERQDGFGAQFQTIIACVIYAELTNKKYVYSPFKMMEHNYDNDPDFIAKKEWLINFINNFEMNDGHAHMPNVNLIYFFEANLDKCVASSALQNIKRIFRANKTRTNYFNNENLNIVIHMRRPNSHDSRLGGVDTPDKVFLDIIDKLRMIYFDKKPLFHLHTQGNSEQFKAFEAPDIIFHINESTEDAFTSMVLADVLVTSASSLSYTAGILSDGVVYYMPFWHVRLPSWISIDSLLGQ